jgi:broad specificity phosphatase PhoE
VAHTLDQIISKHAKGQIAIVTHGGTLRAGLAHLFPDTMSDWWAYRLHNSSLTHVHVSGVNKTLIALNDCEHLHENGEEPKSAATKKRA